MSKVSLYSRIKLKIEFLDSVYSGAPHRSPGIPGDRQLEVQVSYLVEN